jgi:6,7-dimethyl-8-ribityllumazine synthase
VVRCPGSYEIPLTAQWLLQTEHYDGIIALGVVIRGGTPHFEYVCDAVNRGVLDLNLRFSTPVAFGVLTTDDVQQALDRVGDKGNKGSEAALALLEMIALRRSLA